MRPMSIADVLALNPCWDEDAIRVTARNKRLTKDSYDPREVLRRLRGYVRDCDLAWLFQRYLAKHHAVATGEIPCWFGSVEHYARTACIADLEDIVRVMDMTYAEALAVTE